MESGYDWINGEGKPPTMTENLTVMCKPDFSAMKRGVEKPCLWKCSRVTWKVKDHDLKSIVGEQEDLNQGMFLIHHLLSLHLFDEELWKVLWFQFLLNIKSVNEGFVLIVADINFCFAFCAPTWRGFLLWRHLYLKYVQVLFCSFIESIFYGTQCV